MSNSANLAKSEPMPAKQLARIILERQPLFILDVRNEAAYQDWKIEGIAVESINIPYFEWLEGIDDILKQIPQNRTVLVVCAKEGSSQFVAEQLVESGRTSIYYLKGGMKAWSSHLEPLKIADLPGDGAIYQFVRLGKGCLVYMIISGGEAVIVDTLRMTEVFEQFAEQHHVKIVHTIDTHLHADHISGSRHIAAKHQANYWLPSKDAEQVQFKYKPLEENQIITIGNGAVTIRPLYSPGHTIGSTSLIINDQYLLTGDILFVESIGRPDLAGLSNDWASDLYDTLYDRYRKLSPELIVLPAHFGKMTELSDKGTVSAPLSQLYETNTGLQLKNKEVFKQRVMNDLPPQPNAYQEIRQINMGKLHPEVEQQIEMEIGPNRCAVHDR